MAHPKEESGGTSVAIQPDVVHAIAGQVAAVEELVAKAVTSGATSATAATSTGAAGLAGWSSAATLSQVLAKWNRKSRALTEGAGGLADFSAGLRGLVTEVADADGGNARRVADAGTIDSTMESFREPYSPTPYTAGQLDWLNDTIDRVGDAVNPFD